MIRMSIIGVWVLGWLTGLAAASEQDPQRWLERMAHALQTKSYEGTFVYLNGFHLESMRIARAIDADGERERLISLNGEQREIVRNGHAVTSILPHAKSVFSRKPSQGTSFPAVLGKSFAELQTLYRFLISKPDRVAERSTAQILVVPKDGYRYGYRLWLDSETAIPLKLALVNEQGIPLEQVMFTPFRVLESTELPDIPNPSATPAASQPRKKSAESTKEADFWRVSDLPNGFMLHSQGEEKMPGTFERVRHLVFTDGLVTVSAYIEKMEDHHGLQGASRRGAISAFGVRQSGYQVTVVGEVPPRTVKQIAHSIQVASSD